MGEERANNLTQVLLAIFISFLWKLGILAEICLM